MVRGDRLQKAILLILAILSCTAFADPMFFLTDPTTHFSIELYNNQFKLSMFQPFLYRSVPVEWILPKENKDTLKGLISVESNFFIHALSDKGAMGLTQLMPSTAEKLGVLNPFNVFSSVDGANRYLNTLQSSFKSTEYALSAYYEGPTRVARMGPSTSGLNYATKVMAESERLKNKTMPLRDVLYIQPYVRLGESLSVGSDLYLSAFGIIDFVAGLDLSYSGISHSLLAYTNLSHSFSLIIGEKNSYFTAGICFRKIPDFGVQFLISSEYFDLSILVRMWQLYISAGFSSEGLHVGVIK